MTLDDSEPLNAPSVKAIADRLDRARTSGIPIDPVADELADGGIQGAYAVQLELLRRDLARGASLIGHKVGLTSAVMQRQLGVDQPDFGYLLADGQFASGSRLDVTSFIQPKVEPELAFQLAADLTEPKITRAQAVASIERVHGALEIIDSRISGWRITILDTVADNASGGGFVLSDEPLSVSPDDLTSVTCDLLADGELVASGVGSDVLGDPIEALRWAAMTLVSYGTPLRTGQWVLPGSFTAAQTVVAGTTYTARINGVECVSVAFDESRPEL